MTRMNKTRVTPGINRHWIKESKRKELVVLTYFTKFLVIDRSDNATLVKEYRMMKTMNAWIDDGINHKDQFASTKKRNKTVGS